MKNALILGKILEKRIFGGVLLVFLLFVISFTWENLSRFSKGNDEQLYVGLMDWPGFYPAILAKELGYFEDQNLKVNLLVLKDNPEINNKFAAKEIDIAFGTFSDFSVMKSDGIPMKYIYTTDYSKMDSIIANVENMSELKGKKIGIGDINSFSSFFIHYALEKNNLKESDVSFKLIPFDQISSSIDKKIISAGHTWEPELSVGLQKGYRVIFSSKEDLGIITDGVAIREDVANYQEKTFSFLKAFHKAQVVLLSDKDKCYDIINKYFPMEKKEFLRLLAESVKVLSPKEVLESTVQNGKWGDLRFNFQKTLEFYGNRGQVKTNSLFESLVDLEGIRRVAGDSK